MATRRMFSKEITSSDAFLDMPSSTQCLYFQLGMHADDDGFLGSARRISRMLGCGEDDLKILIAKNFVLVFDTGICVITHRNVNNQIRRDRHKQTMHIEEFSQISKAANGIYKRDLGDWQPIGNQLATKGQPSIGENSIEEVSIDKSNSIKEPDGKSTLSIEDFTEKWNDIHLSKIKKQLPKTIKITDKIRKERKRVTKEYTIEEIKIGVNNYCHHLVKIRNDEGTYKDHRFTMYYFLKREGGLANFINYQP